ncbi:PREDICTED: disease resistance protein RPP4-like isoform X1 [Camelina sativa]|uniref:Disease resistance protein RPP4-like isoform X1 n=1 Tax=Camelina sativa TaxID=90675 RepID=A0ABM0STV4_CAMSA|nr:PREDICTED: disease resistance protein RPP4-like isoform X1 [Camelina sativa]
MTSSSSSSTYFDIFLSSAEDTGKGLASHLYRSLYLRGIPTYLRDAKLEERPSSSLVYDARKYIQGSKFAVVVVSQSYPTSVWCLEELQILLNFHDQGRLYVLPIFYEVSFSDIRSQTGAVAEPFRKLGETYPDKVQAWRIALIKLTDIPGLDLHHLSEVDVVLNRVLLYKSEAIYPRETKGVGLLGLDRHMKALYQLLDLKNSTEEVRLIGIWGPGGVGKTTLARFAYDDLYNNFHTHVFVDKAENIYYQDLEKPRSEETLTSGGGIRSVSTGMIKSTVGHRKGLLVIDCVDNLEQLKAVAEILSWCGSGSRVILITQDKNLLTQFGVQHVYEVKSLRYDDALQLFSQSAFERQNPPTSFESLSLRAVQVASFLPLTLTILGSSLRNKNEEEWEKELQKLEGDRENTIMEIMKKSYTREDENDQIPSFILP